MEALLVSIDLAQISLLESEEELHSLLNSPLAVPGQKPLHTAVAV